MTPTHWVTIYWRVWALASFTGFIVMELWTLATNPANSLSANIWRFESFRTGQPVGQWTFAHFMFIALLLVLDVWLLGHFGWGRWR